MTWDTLYFQKIQLIKSTIPTLNLSNNVNIFQPNYTSIINTCNLWRNFDDIQDSWNSVERTIDYYGDNQDIIIANAGPGHWNDPDMVSGLHVERETIITHDKN